MSKYMEQLTTLREGYEGETDEVERRIKRNIYRLKIIQNLEKYFGPSCELPAEVRNIIYKEERSSRGRFLFKTDIWYLVGFFVVNLVPQDLAEAWAVEFEKVNADLEEKWDEAWINIKKEGGYFSYDTLTHEARYCNDLTVCESWKDGNWKNPMGKDKSRDEVKRPNFIHSERKSKFAKK